MDDFNDPADPAPPPFTPLSLSTHSLPTSSVASPTVRKLKYAFSTQCVTVDPPPDHSDPHNASSVPIYQSATFKGLDGSYDYTRSGNPTRTYLEHHLAKLSGAKYAFVTGSGMGALDVLTRILKPGEEVIAGDDLYGGTNRLLAYLKEYNNIVVHHIDTTANSPAEKTILPILSAKTRLVLLETPTNPLLRIADLRSICKLVREHSPQAIIVVDNTMMSPFLQRPLELGADVVYDSATKYLSGHHDLMAGVIVCNRDDIGKHIAFTINATGAALAPFESFLLLRGSKTLALRMSRQQSTAQTIASWLHSLGGFEVFYPGLSSHPGYETHWSQAAGAGAVLSFRLPSKDTEQAETVIRNTKLFSISVSFGSVNSLISLPCLMSHASIPKEKRAERGLPEDLIRLCVGIEDWRDLVNDLGSALKTAGVQTNDVEGEWLVEEDLGAIPRSAAGAITKSTSNPGPSGPAPPLTPEQSSSSSNGNSKGLTSSQSGGESGMENALENATSSSKPTLGGDEERSVLVSAPGKVILFGEHAVVHGVTALAASISLRCYAHLRLHPSSNGVDKVSLSFLEISFVHSWNVDALPWDSRPADIPSGDAAEVTLSETLLSAIEALIDGDPRGVLKPQQREASKVFLYLYMILIGPKPTGPRSATFSIRSQLPVGAGLGSSAAYSTCVAGAFLTSLAILATPSAPQYPSSDYLNKYAFLGEKILHGTPSGVDNACSVYGGGVAFRRAVGGKPGGMENIKGFKALPLLITDTKVGRDTKSLVRGVGLLKEKEPERINKILDDIQDISDRAKAAISGDSERREIMKEVRTCITSNQALLRELGVSHPSLEKVIEITGGSEWGLATKLTGAGGGGCAVTLLDDDMQPDKLRSLQNTLLGNGFKPYIATVGGQGFSVLATDVDITRLDQEFA